MHPGARRDPRSALYNREMEIKITARLAGRYDDFPNGKPVRSEVLDDGRTRHHLENGRTFTVSKPTYRLDYLSTWVGAAPGDTYEVNIALAGPSSIEGFYEAWNFDIGEARNYKLAKTVRLTHLETGQVFSREDLEAALKAISKPQRGADSP